MRDTSVLNNPVVDAIRQTLASALPVGGEAWLYGSQARGEARADSDWDVLLLLDKDRIDDDDFLRVSYPLNMLGWKLGTVINPQLYSKKEWEKYHFTPFYHNVIDDRIRL